MVCIAQKLKLHTRLNYMWSSISKINNGTFIRTLLSLSRSNSVAAITQGAWFVCYVVKQGEQLTSYKKGSAWLHTEIVLWLRHHARIGATNVAAMQWVADAPHLLPTCRNCLLSCDQTMLRLFQIETQNYETMKCVRLLVSVLSYSRHPLNMH